MEFATVVVTSLGAGTVAAIATIWASAFGYWNKNRSQDIEMVNIALSILGGDNKDTSKPGRRFALRVLEKYAGVDIPKDEFEEWSNSGTLPADLYIGSTLMRETSSDPYLRQIVASALRGYRRQDKMKCFVVLNGAMIPPAFDSFEDAKKLADEHIAADPNSDVAIDIYHGEPGQNLVETFRKSAKSEEWVKNQ